MTKKNSLMHALETGKLKARPVAEIEKDLDETIQWAENVAKAYPVKVRRGRPPRNEPGGRSRSVTVRFPPEEAQRVLSSAEAMGLSLSEFVRAAAFQAATSRAKSGSKK